MSGTSEPVVAFDLDALNQGNRGVRLRDPEIAARVEALLAQMTLEQKVAQMHGASIEPVDDLYPTHGDAALAVPAFQMVDGPRGVRAGTATAFPVAMARGAAWDPGLEARIGQAIAREARARGANVLLAPAINLLRHPGWGRAQETYGEDPLHVGRLGAAFVAGAQRELVASVKHFALNSIEDTRFEVDVRVDERTLREVYLPHFELCVRGAHVGSVMSAYNRVNGAYASENPVLLREILKREWGFLGFVESDWSLGTRSTLDAARAGLDIEMPQACHFGPPLARAVRAGAVPEAMIDEAVRRILRVKLAFGLERLEPQSADVVECHEHQQLALEAAHKSIVLLKNEGELLPLRAAELRRVAVVGSLASLENTGDRGSSAVTASFVISPLEGIRDALPRAALSHIARDTLSANDRAEISAADVAIVVLGLTWREEGEKIPFYAGGGDRASLRLPREQEALVTAVCELNPRTVVLLEGGSALEVRSFVDRVPALLMVWYPGMLGGEAIADVLLGRVCPSGKLPVSFARSARDLVPFDHHTNAVEYGRYHGYRQLERDAKVPEFPFGFGLSYTRFRYLALSAPDAIDFDESAHVEVEVENVGDRAGEEIVQLYLSAPEVTRERAPHELVGFGRLALRPGETRRLSMRVTPRELATYDVDSRQFAVEPGRYRLSAGPSSRELPLHAELRVRPARS